MSTTQDLAGKTAIVTGGSRGFGRGIVEALAARGARVVALARDPASLKALAEQLPGVVTQVGDAADEATAEQLLSREKPDLVVLCAGAMPALGPFQEQTWEAFSGNWHVDAKSAFVWLKQALRLPLRSGSHLVVVSSGAAIQGSPVSGGYAPAKRAQWFLAGYAVAESERGGLGLRVHCLLPDLNASTELGRAGVAAYAQRAGTTAEAFMRRFDPPLTPAIVGAAVGELAVAPERWPQLAYRLGGGGLAPLG